jgi:branched-subunit amino acid aminotransferase/4-amino-4-deoxychorismate lyase
VNNSSTQYLLFKEDLSEMNLDGCTKKELFELYKEIEKEVEEQKKIQKREDEEIKNYFKSKE